MKQLTSFAIDAIYESIIVNEVASMIAEETMVNEAFKSSILQKLATAIYNAEKNRNIAKSNRAKEDDERSAKNGYAYKHDPHLVNFASIFGPKIEPQRWGPNKKGIQGLKWSEITDDKFKKFAPDDKELIKMIKKSYGKKDGNADFIVVDKNDNPINFIKAYGKDEKSDGMYYFKSEEIKKYGESEYKTDSEVKELTKQYYSYQTRSLKVGEVIDALKGLATIEGVQVYALEITSDMIKDYKTEISSREEAQKGVINYDKDSLEQLRKNQVARYKALAEEVRAKKLQSDPSLLWDDIKKTNEAVVALYEKIIKNPEYLDVYLDIARLMDYVGRAYESFYRSMKEKRAGDKTEKNAKDKHNLSDEDAKVMRKYNDERSDSEINDAKDYIDKVKKEISNIESKLKE